MLEAPDRTLLVTPLRFAPSAPARRIAARPAAVLVAPIAPTADPEPRSALLAPPPSKLRLTLADRTHPALLWTRAINRANLPQSCGAFAATREAQTYRSLGVDSAEASLFPSDYRAPQPPTRAPAARMMSPSSTRRQFTSLRVLVIGDRHVLSARVAAPRTCCPRQLSGITFRFAFRSFFP